MFSFITTWLFKKYVAVDTYIQHYLPYEKSVYVSQNGNLRNVTIPYYICLFLNRLFIGSRQDYLITYRHCNKRRIVSNANFLSVINEIRAMTPQSSMRIPIYGLIIRANDIILDISDKQRLLTHDSNDNVSQLYKLYYGEELYYLEVTYKGQTRKWDGVENCGKVVVRDVLC